MNYKFNRGAVTGSQPWVKPTEREESTTGRTSELQLVNEKRMYNIYKEKSDDQN